MRVLLALLVYCHKEPRDGNHPMSLAVCAQGKFIGNPVQSCQDRRDWVRQATRPSLQKGMEPSTEWKGPGHEEHAPAPETAIGKAKGIGRDEC